VRFRNGVVISRRAAQFATSEILCHGPSLEIESTRERCGQAQLYIYSLRNNAHTAGPDPAAAARGMRFLYNRHYVTRHKAAIDIGPQVGIRFPFCRSRCTAGGSKIDLSPRIKR